ncbi:MAG TPA: MFS transporter [Actinotalea sp.]
MTTEIRSTGVVPVDRAAGRPTSSRRAVAALLLLVSAQFVVMLDTSIVNVALPSLQQDLGLGPTSTAWVVNAYFLAFGGFLLLSGRAADLLGRRRMFVIGAAVLSAATLVAGFASSATVLIAARAMQGAGAAALSPAALSILLVLFPGAARARAMGAWGAASTLGGATGVLAGGLVTAAIGWSGVFFLTLPFTLGALLAAPRLLGRFTAPTRPTTLDVPGAATVTAAALAVIFGTISAADHGWSSWQTVVGLAVGAALLAAFVALENASAAPLLPLPLLRVRPVAVGIAVGVLGGAARASTFYLVALYLQQVLAMGPRLAGLAMVPTSLAGFAASLLVLPRLLRAFGPQRTLTLGLLVLAAGHLWLAGHPLGDGYRTGVLPGLLLAAAGVALSFTPSTMVIAAAIPLDSAGMAAGLANAASQIGAALGISAFSAIAAVSAHAADLAVTVGAAEPRGFGSAFTAAGVVALAGAGLSLFGRKASTSAAEVSAVGRRPLESPPAASGQSSLRQPTSPSLPSTYNSTVAAHSSGSATHAVTLYSWSDPHDTSCSMSPSDVTQQLPAEPPISLGANHWKVANPPAATQATAVTTTRRRISGVYGAPSFLASSCDLHARKKRTAPKNMPPVQMNPPLLFLAAKIAEPAPTRKTAAPRKKVMSSARRAAAPPPAPVSLSGAPTERRSHGGTWVLTTGSGAPSSASQ